jgi:predicted nucleotidyltransferase
LEAYPGAAPVRAGKDEAGFDTIKGMTEKIPSHPELSKLTGIFCKYAEIQAVYLFGSTASGKTHTESDLDLAVLPRDKSLRDRKLDILADLAREGFCNVDLVFLDTEDVIVKFESVRQNRMVYCAESFDAGDFFSLTLRQYFDFVPYLKIQREAYRKRVLHDGEKRSYS